MSRFLLHTVGRRVELQTDALVHRFFTRWGWDIFDEPLPAPANLPLVLVADWNMGPLELAAHVLRRGGFPVTSAHTAPVMLAKVKKLRPALIVTGLNILRACPLAYEWMLFNLASDAGTPTVFWTGASAERLAREVPVSPRARVCSKSAKPAALLETACDLLRLGRA